MSQWGKVQSGKCPVGELSVRGNVRSGKCSSEKCPSGKCQSGDCPRGSIRIPFELQTAEDLAIIFEEGNFLMEDEERNVWSRNSKYI